MLFNKLPLIAMVATFGLFAQSESEPTLSQEPVEQAALVDNDSYRREEGKSKAKCGEPCKKCDRAKHCKKKGAARKVVEGDERL